MKRLFSPWRMKYIENTKSSEEGGCVFCDALAQEDSPSNLVIARGKEAFAMLNLFPYTSGHMMVASFDHKSNLDDLNASDSC